MLGRVLRSTLLCCLVALFLSSCYVVYEDKVAGEEKTGLEAYFQGQSGFNEEKFVNEQWESQVLPYVQENADSLQEVLQALREDPRGAMEEYGYREVADPKNPFAFLVEGSGVVVSTNTESRAGRAEIDLQPTDGNVELLMQLGPVYQGSSVRDAIEFLKYEDFTNQMEWASVGEALNTKAGQEIFDDISRENLEGRTVGFSGAFSLYQDETLEDVTPVLMPVTLSLQSSGSGEASATEQTSQESQTSGNTESGS